MGDVNTRMAKVMIATETGIYKSMLHAVGVQRCQQQAPPWHLVHRWLPNSLSLAP